MRFGVALVSIDAGLKPSPRDEVHDLRKNHLSFVHWTCLGLEKPRKREKKMKSMQVDYRRYSLFINRLRRILINVIGS